MFQKESSCDFCQPKELQSLYSVKNYPAESTQVGKQSCQVRMQHTLYYKYSSSQNYHYTKEVNEILGNMRTPANIRFNDLFCYDDEDEYLKRTYEISEYNSKVQLLSEFYKFHKDLPRWTISQHLMKVLNYYYDKKRKLEYYKIQRIIEEENRNNPNQPAKGIVGDRPIESCSTPFSESSETLNVNPNVDNILNEVTLHRTSQSRSIIRFTPPPRHSAQIHLDSESFPRVFVPPLKLETARSNRLSTDMQQMVSLLSIVPSNPAFSRFDLEADVHPQLRLVQPPVKLSTLECSSQATPNGNNKQPVSRNPSSSNNNSSSKPVFHKKKFMQKKLLKLDDVALSSSSRHEERLPQSARYQSKPMDTSTNLSSNQARSQFQQKGSQTSSRERIKQDLLKHLKKQQTKIKNPPTPRPYAPHFELMPKPKVQPQPLSISKPTTVPSTTRNTNKKTFNQLLMPAEMKKLEMKVLQGLQDLQKRTISSKLSSFDQKSLHQILASYQTKVAKHTGFSSRQGDSSSQFDSQNFSDQHKLSQTPRGVQKPPTKSPFQPTAIKVGKLDLRKLKSFDANPISQAQSARNDSSKRQSQHRGLQTDRIKPKQQTQSGRNSSLYPITPRVLDRRLQSINNLMQWQIKAIQAASKEYNLFATRK